MAISAAAKSHHDQLFGDRVSALAQSDPELIEYFGNFAFDEVHADAARLDETLDLHTRLMVQLAAILAAGGLAEFRVVAAAAVANGGVSPVELKEIVYQSVAYVGMARAFDYLHAVNDVLTEARVELPLPGQSASTPQTRLEHGKAMQGRIVGDDAVAARLTGTPADEVHFQRYLAANCFGDTVGRGGIDLEVRERDDGCRGDPRCADRSRAPGQGPLHRILLVLGQPDRRGAMGLPRAEPGPVRHRAAPVLDPGPRYRGGRAPDGAALRHGNARVQPAVRWLADRPVAQGRPRYAHVGCTSGCPVRHEHPGEPAQ